MIILDESIKSEAQLKLAEKLERDRKKLQDQIKKDHKQILEKKRKSKNLIGDLFAEHLPDFYNYEAEELKDIIDTAMTQKATEKKIAAIKKAAGVYEEPAAVKSEEVDPLPTEIVSDEPSSDVSGDDLPENATEDADDAGSNTMMVSEETVPEDSANKPGVSDDSEKAEDGNSAGIEADIESSDFTDVSYDSENSEG